MCQFLKKVETEVKKNDAESTLKESEKENLNE